MRTFKLINANGIEKNLTLAQKLFFYNVDGLGYDDEYEFQRVGERFDIVRDELAQAEIEGFVKFWQPTAAQDYFDFVQFCQNKPLRLVYNPGIGNFFRDVIVTSIGKSDSADGALKCSIRLSCMTPFYKIIEQYSDGIEGDGKKYNYTYDYTYTNSASQSVVIDSDSYQPSPAKLTIYGPAQNPAWRWYVNNVLVGTGKINGVINDGMHVVIDTTSIPYQIKQFDGLGNLISDMYQQSDFSTERFIRLAFGNNTISVAHDGISGLRMGVEAHIEYASI